MRKKLLVTLFMLVILSGSVFLLPLFICNTLLSNYSKMNPDFDLDFRGVFAYPGLYKAADVEVASKKGVLIKSSEMVIKYDVVSLFKGKFDVELVMNQSDLVVNELPIIKKKDIAIPLGEIFISLVSASSGIDLSGSYINANEAKADLNGMADMNGTVDLIADVVIKKEFLDNIGVDLPFNLPDNIFNFSVRISGESQQPDIEFVSDIINLSFKA